MLRPLKSPSTMATMTNSEVSSNANTTQQSNTSGSHSSGTSAIGPADIPISEHYINDNNWPKDFKLDLQKNNSDEWSFQITLLAGRQGFSKYLNGKLPQPSIDTHPHAHHIWGANNECMKHFIFTHISRAHVRNVSHLPTSQAVFEELRKIHEKQGLHAQMILIQKALEIRSRSGKPLLETAEEIDTLHARIANMGSINLDDLHSILLLNCLSSDHETVRSHLLNIQQEPSFSSKSIMCCFAQEDSFTRNQGSVNPPASSAFAAQGLGKTRPFCNHCKKPGHLADFCIAPGGKMAGRSVDDARAAQRAASGKPLRTPAVPLATAKVATSDSTPATQNSAATPAPSVVIGGITYYPAVAPTPSTACIAFPQTSDSGNLTDSSGDSNPYSFHSYLALTGPLVASVDWKTHSVTSEVSDTITSPVLSSRARALVFQPLECPFILDSGASHHISPE